MCDWLPDLITLDEYDGDWSSYIEAVYKHFHYDFIANRPRYIGQPVSVRKEPRDQGKEAGFWHATSEGKDEWTRTPDLRRCERIRWIRKIVECTQNDSIRRWHTKRGSDKRVLLALPDFSYVVVLAVRKKYVLFITAYFVEFEGRRKKLKREWKEWVSAQKG